MAAAHGAHFLVPASNQLGARDTGGCAGGGRAAAAGGRGTPHSIILVDGEQVPVQGAQPYEVIKGLIDTLLEK